MMIQNPRMSEPFQPLSLLPPGRRRRNYVSCFPHERRRIWEVCKNWGAGNSVANSLYEYNANNALTSILHKKPDETSIVQHSYTYDETNNIVEYLNSIDGNTEYNYDFLGQLIGADYENQNLTDESYSYDSNGNRITANGSNYITGSNNELTSDGSWSYVYDDEGNRISKTNSTNRELYEWDYRNRLTSVTQQEYNSTTEEWQTVQIIEYAYDYNNIWIRKTLDTNGDGTPDSKSIFIPENYQTTVQLDDTDLSDNVDAPVTHHYLWMPNQQDKLLADTTNTTILWSLTDHLGTIRDILSTTETTHLIYDAFGNLISGTNPILFGYTGKAFDTATNLQNNINRWYDATVGRWLSTDPIGFEGNDTNLYRYVKNRANICFDFSGTQASISHKFEGNWTDNDKKKILDALDVLAVRLLTIQKKLDEFFPMIADNEKYSCECRRAIIEEFAKFRTVLQYSLKVALGDYPMKFHQQVLYKNPVFINFFTGDTSVEGKHTPGNIWLNLAPMEDWKNNPDLPRLLFHEISHEFGTEDNGSLLFDDAHFIENYAQKIITPNFSLHLDRVAQSLPECQEV